VVGALLGDSKSLDTVMAIAEPVMAVDSDVNLWTVAARNGVDNNILGRAAIECFDAALSALGKLDGGGSLKAIVDNFAEKYESRRRCPADDLVERIDV
ncbi:MAG TPA: ergothioneine biosynthesis glutamate--cysteine ligase EgtA, partial [Streptosporangiaceae bacterium]|nr:ergothioneine biosynthesis glutamate--cysteine ligase EgtA [Streptosporangiaceae bacterium]